MNPSLTLRNWIPLRRQKSGEELLCEWLHVGDRRFTEPFFDDTIRACRFGEAVHRRYKSLSNLDSMLEWSEGMSALPLTAIIFHVSRCGSTLLSQLLAADEKNAVLSEVPFFDEMLRLPFQRFNVSVSRSEDYFRGALSFYGQQRIDGQQHLFIKADCWHLHFYEQLRRMFPRVPFFLLYREPMAVLRSQQQQRGLQSVPGLIEPEVFGLTMEQCRDTNLDRYMANVLATLFQKMTQIVTKDPLAFPLDFARGMDNNVRKIYQQLRLPLDPALAALFEERCRFHGKRPQQVYAVDPVVQEIPVFAEEVMHLYQKLTLLTEASPAIS